MPYTVLFRGAASGAVTAEAGETLLTALQRAGAAPEAPCGGHGTCGKCRVLLETAGGTQAVLACQTPVTADLSVILPEKTAATHILTGGCEAAVAMQPLREGPLLAFDIGTTTVVCYLLDGATGEKLDAIDLNGNIEASAAVFNNTVVVGHRSQKIFGIALT